VAAVIRHSLAEGWLLLRSRGLVSPILAVALAIPISLAGVTVSVRQWLAPVVELGERESVVTVLLHPRLGAAERRSWIDRQAAHHSGWRLREVGREELAERLSRWFPYLEELLAREGPEMLPPMVEIVTAEPTGVAVLRDDAAVLAVGPTSSVNRMVGRVAGRFAVVLLVVAAALMAGALLFAGVWVHLELHRNAEEIAIMRLMGATESTVRGPFLVAVTAPALIAAATSVVITVVTVGWMARMAAPLGLTAAGPPWWVLLAEAVTAVVLPVAAAHVTLERHASTTGG
jgi:cell division transport system permease protein